MYINDGSVLGIDVAASLAAHQIKLSERRYTKVDIGFGDIIITTTDHYDPISPIDNVCHFEEAPIESSVVRDNMRNGAIKFYAEIPYKKHGMSLDILQHEVALALIKAALMYTTRLRQYAILDEYVYECYDTYRTAYCSFSGVGIMNDKYVDEMIISGGILKVKETESYRLAKRLAKKHFANLLADASKIHIDAKAIAKNTNCIVVGNAFHQEVLMISMLLINEVRTVDFSYITKEYMNFLAEKLCTWSGSINAFTFIRFLLDKDTCKYFKEYEKIQASKKLDQQAG